MKQKEFCLGLLGALGVFATLRAVWTSAVWLVGIDGIPDGTASYNLLYAVGIWCAWHAARRIPTT